MCCRFKIIDGLGIEVQQPGLKAGLQTVIVFDLLSEFANTPEIKLTVGSLFELRENRQTGCGKKGEAKAGGDAFRDVFRSCSH